MTKPFVFAAGGPDEPAVAFVELDGLTVAVWAKRGIDARQAIVRAIPVEQRERGNWVDEPLSYREVLAAIKLKGPRPPEWFGKYRSLRVDPVGMYGQRLASGMSEDQAVSAALNDQLDTLYFAVGGPIHRYQSEKKASALIILGDRDK